jgi:nicotinamidase-related amidase
MAEQLTINRNKTAVLVMDFQIRQVNALLAATRAALLPNVKNVLAKARAAKIPVIFIEVVRGERTPENALYNGFVPEPGEPLLTKHRTGPWTTTNLDELLKKQGIDTLVLMGINTSRVVLTTICFAADMDYKLVVLSDCCADADEELHKFLMEQIFPRNTMVTTAAKFLNLLGHS